MFKLFKKFFKKKRDGNQENIEKTDPNYNLKFVSEPDSNRNDNDLSIVNNHERGNIEEDDNIIIFYENNPIFMDFLIYNDASLSFLENTKGSLKVKKWIELTDEERCYYLANKASYFQTLVRSKLEENRRLDRIIEKKKQNIKRLAYEIDEKKKNNNVTDEINKEKVGKYNIYYLDNNINIENLKEQTSELELKIELIDKRIEDINIMLSNFDNPINTLSIEEILKGLKEEKKRIKDEIDLKHSYIKDFEEKINYYKESIQILEMKFK